MVFRWAVIVFLILHVIERAQWSASGQKWNIIMLIWNTIYSKTRLYRVSDRWFLSVFTTCNLGTWSEKSFRFNCQFFKSVFAITGVYCKKKRACPRHELVYLNLLYSMCGTTHMYFKVLIKFCTIREDLNC